MNNKIYQSLILFTLLFLSNILFAQSSKTISEFYQNGQLKSMESYSDTIKNGYHLVFDRYARMELQEFYIMGKLDGKKIEFDNGRVNTITEYKEGILDGKVQKYFVTRRLMSEESYKDGIKDGESKWFYQNGKLFAIYNYSKSQVVNPVKNFYEDGNLKSEYSIEKGKLNGEFVEYHQDGKTIKSSGKYKNGNKTGKWKSFDNTGKLIKTDKY